MACYLKHGSTTGFEPVLDKVHPVISRDIVS